jgi:hypothetical protein
MPGKNPASATPSRKRTIAKLVEPVTIAVRAARIPQVIVIRASHTPGADLLQDHIAWYLEEETTPVEQADSEPKVPADISRSPRTVSAAKLTLIRSI